MSRRRPTAAEVDELARAAGVELTPWQRDFLEFVYQPLRRRRRPWRFDPPIPRAERRRALQERLRAQAAAAEQPGEHDQETGDL
jgi:hypothetical protein